MPWRPPGSLDFPLVLLTAAVAAVLGDNFGYLVGRLGGYRLLSGRGPLQAHRARLLARGDAFFADHGAMAVFLGRWTPFLRVTAAVLAGTHHMKWRHFLVWNTLGGVGWALTIGGGAYLLGGRFPGALAGIGVAMGVLLAVGLAGRLAYTRIRHPSPGRRVPAGRRTSVWVRAQAGSLPAGARRRASPGSGRWRSLPRSGWMSSSSRPGRRRSRAPERHVGS